MTRLVDSFRTIFREEEGLYDLATTDRQKINQFIAGNFNDYQPISPIKRFQGGGSVSARGLFTPSGRAGKSFYPISGGALGPFVNQNDLKLLPEAGFLERVGTGFLKDVGTTARGIASTVKGIGSTLYDTLGGALNWVKDRPAVQNFMNNLIGNLKAGNIKGGGGAGGRQGLNPQGLSGAQRRVVARNVPGSNAVFRAQIRQTNAAKQLAQVFNKNHNPNLAKITAMHMNNPNRIITAALPSHVNQISVRNKQARSNPVNPMPVETFLS